MDIDEFIEAHGENELEHYGVLGMKWGVRKDPQRAYDKANKKLAKLEDRVNRSKQRVSKLQGKTLRRQERANDALVFKKFRAKRAAKSTRKLGEAYTRVQKRTAKAKKWYDAMSDAFKDVKVSELKTNSASVELGKKYANMSIDSMMNNSASAASMMQLAAYYEDRARR